MALGLVVATHNLMDGRRLGGLIDEHRGVESSIGLAVLCVQENRTEDGLNCAEKIAASLGPPYRAIGDHPRTRLAMVFDNQQLELLRHEIVALPKLGKLSVIERLYIGREPLQCRVQLATFRATGGDELCIANFHLDPAGGNAHRRDQLDAVATLANSPTHFVAAGDTNAFALGRSAQLRALATVLEPLANRAATDPGTAPTHFFSRQREKRLTHRMVASLGRLGLDVPGRYDVVCTNVETAARGQRTTPDSDHDLVWAELRLPHSSRTSVTV